MKKSYLFLILFSFSVNIYAQPPLNTVKKKSNYEELLLGSDKNNNGIRDDIDVIIQKKLKDPLEIITIEKVAKNLQKTLTVGDNLSLAKKVSIQHMNSLQCVYKNFSINNNRAENILKLVKESTFNNQVRRLAYQKYKKTLDDFTPTLSNEPKCNYLEN